jgi:osmotically-inducible protein OsmY
VDEALRTRVEAAVAPLCAGRGEFVNVTVEGGTVVLLGRVGWRSEVGSVGAAAAAVPGVAEVRNRLGCFWDDSRNHPRARWFARRAR